MSRPGWRRLFGVRQVPIPPQEQPLRYTRPEGSSLEIAETNSMGSARTSGRTMPPKRWAKMQEEKNRGEW